MDSTYSRRTRQQIEGEIHAQRQLLAALLELATEYLLIDMRPFYLSADGMQRIGPSPVPEELQSTISAESATLIALELECFDLYRG